MRMHAAAIVTASVLAMGSLSGCVVGKVVATPLTVTRDVVDAPLVSLTNLFELWADRSDPFAPPTPGVSWNWKGGFNFGVFYGLGWFVFKPLSLIFGGVDYVVCRALYPNYPKGLSPWRQEGQSWGDLYFTNTRAMWGDHPPDTIWDAEEAAPAQKAPASATTGGGK